MNRQIKLILGSMAITATIICGCSKENNISDSETDVSETDTSASNVEEIEALQTEIDENTNVSPSEMTESDDNSNAGKSKAENIVDFKISDEIDLDRPSSVRGSEVFVGWEEQNIVSQIGENKFGQGEDVSLTAEIIDISETENAIYNDTIYTGDEAEYVEIPIIVGGNTNFSVLDLEVSFDSNLFSFDSFTYIDEDTVCNCVNDENILISFISMNNVTADVNLCNVKLKKKNLQKTETKLKYVVKDIAAWNADATDYINVTSEIVNNKIVMY